MSSRNRERRRINREARAEAAAAARRRAKRQRWIFGLGGLLVAAAVAVVLVLDPFGDDGDDVEAAPPSAGDCVEVSEARPEGAPEVPVQVGAPPTELVVEDLVVGDGEDITIDMNPSINYIGVACSTGVVFDDSYSKGAPLSPDFDPATPGWEVIPGWQQGIPGMKVGGRRLLGVPPDLGYGDVAQGPDIPANETLWYVVEAVAAQPAAPVETTTVAPSTPTS